MLSFRSFRFIFHPATIFLASVSAVYLHHLTRDIYGGDSGDLVTAAYVLGVAHPPGYPLHTALGYVFIHMFPFLPVVSAVALVSTVSSIATLTVFYLVARHLIKNTYFALISTAILAFSFLFWFYSEIAEVFALNAFFAVLLLALGIYYYTTRKKGIVIAAGFMAGLSLTHHHTVVLVFPSLLILFFPFLRSFRTNWKWLLLAVGAFLLGISFYLYVPFAAQSNPVINWDNAVTLDRFIHLVLRKGYGTFSAGPFTEVSSLERLVIVKAYMAEVVSSLSLPVVLLSLVGATYVVMKQRAIGISLVLAFFLTGPLFISYAGFPLMSVFIIGIAERFYLLSSIVICFFIPFGLWAVYRLLSHVLTKQLYVKTIMAAFVLVPAFLFLKNVTLTDFSDVSMGNTFAKDLLSSAPMGSAVLLAGDTPIFNSWYVHYVTNFRPDIELIQTTGSANAQFLKGELDDYSKRTGKKHPTVGDILIELSGEQYVFSNIELALPDDTHRWIPVGLGYLLVPERDMPSFEVYMSRDQATWRGLSSPSVASAAGVEANLLYRDIMSKYADARSRIALFLFQEYSALEAAEEYLAAAQTIDPESAGQYAAQAIIQGVEYENCTVAEENALRAISRDRLLPEYYTILRLIHLNCYGEPERWEAYRNDFSSRYGIDINVILANSSPSATLDRDE